MTEFSFCRGFFELSYTIPCEPLGHGTVATSKNVKTKETSGQPDFVSPKLRLRALIRSKPVEHAAKVLERVVALRTFPI